MFLIFLSVVWILKLGHDESAFEISFCLMVRAKTRNIFWKSTSLNFVNMTVIVTLTSNQWRSCVAIVKILTQANLCWHWHNSTQRKHDAFILVVGLKANSWFHVKENLLQMNCFPHLTWCNVLHCIVLHIGKQNAKIDRL